MGGAEGSWLVRSTPDRAVRVRTLAGDTVLCSWARYLTVTVPLSTQVYHEMGTSEFTNAGVTLGWTIIPPRGGGGGSRNTPSSFMLQKPEKSAGLMDHLACMHT